MMSEEPFPNKQSDGSETEAPESTAEVPVSIESEQKEWFYEQGGTQQGPVSGETIRGMVSSGIIPQDGLVWKEGLADWIPFEKTELCDHGKINPVVPGDPSVFTPREAKLNPDFNFGVFEALGSGWRLMLTDFWPFVGLFALVSIIIGVAANLVFPIFFLTFPMIGGYMYYTLKRLRGEPADLDNVFDGFKRRFGSLAMLSFLVCLPLLIGLIPLIGLIFYVAAEPYWIESNAPLAIGIIGGGTALFILIYSIVGTITTLASLLCLDCDIGWSKAMGLATRAYGKRFFKMTLYSLLGSFLINAGVLVFYVGCFVSGAWIISSISCVYEKAFGDTRAPI